MSSIRKELRTLEVSKNSNAWLWRSAAVVVGDDRPWRGGEEICTVQPRPFHVPRLSGRHMCDSGSNATYPPVVRLSPNGYAHGPRTRFPKMSVLCEDGPCYRLICGGTPCCICGGYICCRFAAALASSAPPEISLICLLWLPLVCLCCGTSPCGCGG